MTYYKVMIDEHLIGYADSSSLRCYMPKHKALLFCNESRAQFVQIGEKIYRDKWLLPVDSAVEYIEASITAMSPEEYQRELSSQNSK